MNPVDILRLLSLAAIWGRVSFHAHYRSGNWHDSHGVFRVSIAFVGLLVILALMRIDWNFRGKLKIVMVLGLINSGIPATFYSLAAQVLPAGYSAIFNATTPLMGVLIGGLFFSEKLTLAKVSGVFLGLFGVGILTGAGPVAFDLQLLMGALACLLATTCYGFAGFLTRRWLDHQGGLDSRLSALGGMFGATVFCCHCLATASSANHRPVGAVGASGFRCSDWGWCAQRWRTFFISACSVPSARSSP